jgi:putative tricarboxylic transport membrane protein
VVGVTMSARAFRTPQRAAVAREPARDAAARARAVSTVAVLVGFCVLLPWLGYPLVAFAFVTTLLQRLGSPWRTAAIVGAATAAVTFYVFAVLLDVPLPRGPW